VSHVTTHVLDAVSGRPAAGVDVALADISGAVIATATTNEDGRVPAFGPDELPSGAYRVVFDTDAYFGDRPHFYPSVAIDFLVTGPEHYHVPLLLSPFAYSTYRGS
jgi:5-hydroxyisourate hydrolase